MYIYILYFCNCIDLHARYVDFYTGLWCAVIVIGTSEECSQHQDEMDTSSDEVELKEVKQHREVKQHKEVSNALLYNIRSTYISDVEIVLKPFKCLI